MSRTEVLLTAFLCLTLGASTGLAQGLYVTANAGYSLGAGTQYFGQNSDLTKTPIREEGVYGSLGEGLKFGASVGFMFTGNLGAELGFAYWPGKTTKIESKFATGTGVRKWSGSGFVAAPSIVLSANMEPINPYARIGLVLGILEVENRYEAQSTSQAQDIIQEESGKLAVGYAGAVGFLVPAGSTVGFFVEAVIHTVTFSPSQSEFTRYMDNGLDRLPLIQPKVYDFKESITSADENVYMATRRPFSSIGFAAGVRINL